MKAAPLLALLAMSFFMPSVTRADPPVELGEWKLAGKLKAPTLPVSVLISEDYGRIYAWCPEKRKWSSGGFAPGFITITILRCYAVDSGKELFKDDLGQIGGLMSLRSTRLAIADQFDKIKILDAATFKKIGQLDTRSAGDSPKEAIKGVPPGLADFGGGGRLGDIELTSDGKTLVTVRMESTPWKKDAKGFAFTSESFQQVVFWDTDKAVKIATLDCEDKEANNGSLRLLDKRNQMLVKFDNSVRLVDLATRKWGAAFPVKELFSVGVSADEKVLAVADRLQGVRLINLDTGKDVTSFKEAIINRTPRIDGSLTPGRFEFGPTVQFVDEGRVLRVTLNDGKTAVWRDAATGAKTKQPASETLKFPVAGKLVAISGDRRCAVTTTFPPSGNLTVWLRAPKE